MRGKIAKLFVWRTLKGFFFELENQQGKYYARDRCAVVGQEVQFETIDSVLLSGARKAYNLRLAKLGNEPEEPSRSGFTPGRLNFRVDEPVFNNHTCGGLKGGKGGPQAASIVPFTPPLSYFSHVGGFNAQSSANGLREGLKAEVWAKH